MKKISNLAKNKTNKYYVEMLYKIEYIGFFTFNNEKLEQRKLNNNNYLLDIIVTREDNSRDLNELVRLQISGETEIVYSKNCNLLLYFLLVIIHVQNTLKMKNIQMFEKNIV